MRNMCLALALLLAPGAAIGDTIYGEDGEVLYFGARSGASFVGETDFNVAATPVENEYEIGYVVGAFVGFGTELSDSIGLRGELEFGGQSASVENHNVAGAATPGSFGKTQQRHVYLNFVTDLSLTNDLTAFAGGGIGMASIKFDSHGVPALGTVVDDKDSALAYNLSTGLGYEIGNGVVMEGMYRYMATVGAQVEAVDGTKTDVDLKSHNFLLGLRIGM